MSEIDEPPTNLPPLPEGVTFDGFQLSGTGVRYWQFTEVQVSGSTFLVAECASGEVVAGRAREVRQRFIKSFNAEVRR